MSGGVDSSVAAAILAGEGHDVVGVSLQLSDHGSAAGAASRCCSPADLRDARLVAGRLGIPHYVLNQEEAFEREILDPFLDAYRRGTTPNPCVRCNSALKFGALLKIARAIGATCVATGHYARKELDVATGRHRILRAVDRNKDQSYFLFDLDEEQIEAARFPLGGMSKTRVSEMAFELGLPVAGKRESQDLCFIPDGDVASFLEERIGAGAPGEIVDTEGGVLGAHGGVHGYTVGQRRGIGISSRRPLYVLSIDAARNRVVVGGGEDLDADVVVASGCRISDPEIAAGPTRVEAKIRSRHDASPGIAEVLPAGRVRMRFDEPQRAVTPGQALVIYRGEAVAGGGWIESASLDRRRESPVAWSNTAERA
jgi:tRNA-specific 2-thiouridylase